MIELLVVFLLLLMFGLAVPVGTSYWVYKDATARGNENATLWTIATMLVGLFVFIVGSPAVAFLYVLIDRE